jgi:hypothetical protein
VIKAITKEKEEIIKAKNNEISDLKSKIEAKEGQINNLK